MDIYRENILDHYQHPRNFGLLAAADIEHTELNPFCGDEFTLRFRINNETIEEMKFDGHGCAISTAGASILTEKITGRSVAQVKAITDQDMLDELGVPLSPTRTKCGLLAVSGMRRALGAYSDQS